MTPGPETYTNTISNESYEDRWLAAPPHFAGDVSATTEDSLNLLFRRLETMSRVLEVDKLTDFAELCFSSHSTPAICVFRKVAVQTDHIKSLFQELKLGKGVEDFFWVVLARVPAERHAVRLSLDNKFSVFFKTNFPTIHIIPVAEAIDLKEQAEPVFHYFAETGRVASGIAWELGEGRLPRLRFYDNVIGFPEFVDTSILLPLIPRDYLRTLRGLCGDATASPSVLNFSITRDGLSVKVEAPDVTLAHSSLPGLRTEESGLFTQTFSIMERCKLKHLNYFGLRFRGSNRELTCYLDAFAAQSQMDRTYESVS